MAALVRRVVARARPVLRRPLCVTSQVKGPGKDAETISFTFVDDGEEVHVSASAGTTLLEAAHANEIDLEGECMALRCATRGAH